MRYFVIVIIICLATKTKGQLMYNTERQDSTNVYHKALTEFCGYIEKYFPAVSEITIESTPMTTMFPVKMGNIKLDYLARTNVKKEFKKKGISYYCVITPLLLRSGEFSVNVIPLRIDYQKNLWTKFEKDEIGYVSSGGIKSRFKYDCSNGNLIFIGSEGGFDKIK
jgi:hypothetical protein